MPLTDLVPRSEAALSRLQQVLVKTGDPALTKLRQSLDALSDRLGKSKDETLYVVQNARSAELLYGTGVQWFRDKQELETLNAAVGLQVQSLTDDQRQVRELQQTWSLAGKSGEEAGLPQDLLARIWLVSQTASTTDARVQAALESLVTLQVRISDNRKVVDDILQQIAGAAKRLHGSILVLDGPPLWSALREGSYASLREQARVSLIVLRSRTLSFFSTRRGALLAYLVLLLALTGVFSRIRASLDRPATEEALVPLRLLHKPFSVALFTFLFLFAFFFPNAPVEVVRLSQFLLIVPMVPIALAVFEDVLRWPVITLVVFCTLDAMTVHMAAGTLLRRLVVLVLSAGGVAGLWWLLRARSPVPRLLAQRIRIARPCARLALIAMAVAVAASIVGSVSLADLLMHGTLWSIYAGMALYVMYLAFYGLIWFLTGTRIGQMSRLVRLHRERVLARVDMLSKLACWIAWVISVLASYQVAPYVFAALRSALNFKWAAGAVTVSVRDIVLFFFVLIVASAVAKGVRFFLEEEILPRTPLSPGVAQSSSRLIYVALASIGLYLALAAGGVDLTRATLLTGAFGVGLGFGLQNVVNNFVSGIIISLERPIQVGDTIEIGSLLGKVTAIGFRSSTMRTADGAEVIVPNAELVSKSVVNWSHTDQLRRGEQHVFVAYGTDPARVLQLLAKAVSSHPDVMKSPEPLVTFEGFGEDALDFCVRFWTAIDKLTGVRSDLNLLVAAELGKNGVLLARPQQDARPPVVNVTGT